MKTPRTDSDLLLRLREWERSCPAASFISGVCEGNMIHAYYFGGVCRSVATLEEPRDIDLVIDPLHWDRFVRLMPTGVRNSFGGQKYTVAGMSVDAWNLRDTWSFTQSIAAPASPTILPETVLLNVEAVLATVWHPAGGWIFQKGFYDTIDKHTLEVQNWNTPFPELALARILKFEMSGWQIGKTIRQFRHLWREIPGSRVEDAFRKHYRTNT